MKFLWGLTIVGCLIGMTLIFDVGMENSSPKQAAAAAVAAAIVIVPYCLARAFQEFDGNAELRKIRKLLEQQQSGARVATAAKEAA